jgi:hypothetical protein
MKHRILCSKGGLIRSPFAIAAAALTLGLFTVPALAPAALADQTQHSIHAPLSAAPGEPLRSGFVEDIHANGPTIYAQEIYQLNGAKPSTTYQVTLNIYNEVKQCTSFAISPILTDNNLTTNTAGDAKGQATFTLSAASATGLRGGTYGVIWTVSDSGGVAYQTACTAVTLD